MKYPFVISYLAAANRNWKYSSIQHKNSFLSIPWIFFPIGLEKKSKILSGLSCLLGRYHFFNASQSLTHTYSFFYSSIPSILTSGLVLPDQESICVYARRRKSSCIQHFFFILPSFSGDARFRRIFTPELRFCSQKEC